MRSLNESSRRRNSVECRMIRAKSSYSSSRTSEKSLRLRASSKGPSACRGGMSPSVPNLISSSTMEPSPGIGACIERKPCQLCRQLVLRMRCIFNFPKEWYSVRQIAHCVVWNRCLTGCVMPCALNMCAPSPALLLHASWHFMHPKAAAAGSLRRNGVGTEKSWLRMSSKSSLCVCTTLHNLARCPAACFMALVVSRFQKPGWYWMMSSHCARCCLGSCKELEFRSCWCIQVKSSSMSWHQPWSTLKSPQETTLPAEKRVFK